MLHGLGLIAALHECKVLPLQVPDVQATSGPVRSAASIMQVLHKMVLDDHQLGAQQLLRGLNLNEASKI